jgi:lambda repressor-like predicted transcriptional regulator
MDPLKILEQRRNGRTIAALSRELGVSPAYLSDVLNGNREPGPKIIDALGLERVVTYRKKKGSV